MLIRRRPREVRPLQCHFDETRPHLRDGTMYASRIEHTRRDVVSHSSVAVRTKATISMHITDR
jgi:hypothetical protein